VIVLENAIDTMMPLAQAKEIDLRLSLDTAECAVVGDPGRLQQTVTNLLANAINFTPAGRRVDVGLSPHGSWAVVTVRDMGCGILPDLLPYIFDPFRRVETDLRSRHNGLGLGLAIARQIVEEHGGDISAESPSKGKGTTFTVRLPIADHAPATDLQFS
jgi:signal transduction histidine kinase